MLGNARGERRKTTEKSHCIDPPGVMRTARREGDPRQERKPGASGQTELQDRHQCTMLAADFNYAIGALRQRWESANGPGRWYLQEQAAEAGFSTIVARAQAVPGLRPPSDPSPQVTGQPTMEP